MFPCRPSPRDCILRRYWTKPSKKKDPAELAKNPPKESMMRVGPCLIAVEPHVFDATIYAIRDVQAQTLPSHAMQYSATGTSASSTAKGHAGYLAAPGSSQLHPIHTTAQAPPQPYTPSSQSSYPAQTQGHATPTSVPQAQSQLPQQPQLAKPAQDPVIQMLAQRASQDADLKALMKVVASGSANPEQLKEFQKHIDELTVLLQQQRGAPVAKPAAAGPSSGPASVPIRAMPPLEPRQSQNGPQGQMHQTIGWQQVPAPKPKAPFVAPRLETTGLVVEFAASAGDRFLLPRHAILEYAPGARQVKMSFLVVRTGEELKSIKETSGSWKKGKNYHQPVTITIASDVSRVMESISKGVAPYAEAKRAIDNIKETTIRAEPVTLALQLPQQHNVARDSPAPSADMKPARGGRKGGNEDWSKHCQFCYAPVRTGSLLTTDGRICAECHPMWHKEMSKHQSIKFGSGGTGHARPGSNLIMPLSA
ncbi:hypothetical protein MRB53_037301 [Persea americana]|nr:hypothetical protein MRB53_037301 [Persea americana]